MMARRKATDWTRIVVVGCVMFLAEGAASAMGAAPEEPYQRDIEQTDDRPTSHRQEGGRALSTPPESGTDESEDKRTPATAEGESGESQPNVPSPNGPSVSLPTVNAASSTSTSETAVKQKLFLMTVNLVDQPEHWRSLVMPQLSEAVFRYSGAELVTAEDTQSILALEADRQLLGCDADEACMAALAAKLDVDLLMTAQLGQVGKERQLSLRLIDARNLKSLEIVTGSVTEGQSLKTEIEDLVKTMFGNTGTQSRISFTMEKHPAASFAVLDLESTGVDENVTKNLTQILSAELKKVKGASVVGRDDIAALLDLEAEKGRLGCSADMSCLAEIGGALGVSLLVVGQVGKVQNSFVVSLRLISTTEVKVLNRVSETFRGDEEQLLSATRFAARALLGLTSDRKASLVVTSPHQGAEVFLDQQSLGTFPIKSVDDLEPGRHTVAVRMDGFYDWQSDVFLHPGETSALWVELLEEPAEWYENWVLWTAVAGLGVVTLGTVAGATASLTGYYVWDLYRPHELGVEAPLPQRGAQ